MANVTVQNAIASRLAAAAHLRQARILSLLGARLRSLRAKANALVRRLARKAAELGMAGLPHLAGIIRGELDELRSALEGVLEEFARLGYEMSREMLVKTIGAQRLLALVNRGTMTEAEEPTAGQIVARYQLAGIPPEELETYVKRLLFPPPDAETVSRWLVEKPPGGLSWEERFWRWAVPAQAAFLTQLTQGLAAGENPTQLEQRIRPFADGLFYKSERIARTEAVRVAERANRATAERMGPYLEGLQIVAVMDEWTRPEHAARNGRVFYRGEDGIYRDEKGDILPDLPDEPNCRCMTIPVLTMPPELRGRSAAGEAFRTASGGLIPDPASYAEWWEKASPQEQRIAVGAGRYELVRDRLAKLPTPRPPEWIDFIDTDGKLLSVTRLRNESEEERTARRERVSAMLRDRERAFRAVLSTGTLLPPESGLGSGQGGKPPSSASPASGAEDWHRDVLAKLDLGPPRRVEIHGPQRALLDGLGRELTGKVITTEEWTRLAGGIDRADVILKMEGGGILMETIREEARFVRWFGRDEAGRLKLSLVRADVKPGFQRAGLGTRSLVRSLHQAALLGADYAEGTGLRSSREIGYYHLARLGFDATLPRTWLEQWQGELAKLGLEPTSLSQLMQTEEGRKFWLDHGRTVDVIMNLRPGSDDLRHLLKYLQDREREGRAMAEEKRPEVPPYPRFCAWVGEITEEDDRILDRIWDSRVITEEEKRRKDELFATWKPFSRMKELPPAVEEIRRKLEAEGRLDEVEHYYLP